MTISPEVETPRAGDPITAAWAAGLAAAVNSSANQAERADGLASPFGKAELPPSSPMLGAPHGPILPFECRILRESGASADSLWMAFPDYGSGGRAWVFLDGYAVTHASADGIAIASWTKIADNLTDGTRYRVALAFADTGSSGSGYRWRWGVFVQSGSGALSWPAWADQTMPRVLLVDLQTAGNGTAAANVFKGLAQLHVGELHLTRSWIEYGGGAYAAGAYLVNRNGDRILNLSTLQLSADADGNEWGADVFNATVLKVGGDTYAPTAITYTDGGGNTQTKTFLVKQ